MNMQWPTRASEMKEMLYFFSCFMPFLAGAIALTLLTFLLRNFIGDTIFGITAVGSWPTALWITYLEFPKYLHRKAIARPKISFDGSLLKYPVLTGELKAMQIDNTVQITCARYYLRPTQNTGTMRGIWLELKNAKQRVLFTGDGSYKIPQGISLAEASVPFTPTSEKVRTFAQELIELAITLQAKRAV